MLIFKKNIYDLALQEEESPDTKNRLNPYNFLLTALVSDRDMFAGLKQMDREESANRCEVIFPHASNFGGADVLNAISKHLIEALVHPHTWYRMNTYHLCHLYDSLHSLVEEYSYEAPAARLQMLPELNGEEIDFEGFLDDYFFNTAFLMDQDRFNNLDSDEKKKRGFSDSCLFGVINRLIPSENEIRLEECSENPYE